MTQTNRQRAWKTAGVWLLFLALIAALNVLADELSSQLWNVRPNRLSIGAPMIIACAFYVLVKNRTARHWVLAVMVVIILAPLFALIKIASRQENPPLLPYSLITAAGWLLTFTVTATLWKYYERTWEPSNTAQLPGSTSS